MRHGLGRDYDRSGGQQAEFLEAFEKLYIDYSKSHSGDATGGSA